jgi:putative FmdB family regulatory protein
MPVYAFRCTDCQAEFEVRFSIREVEQGLMPECPSCHGSASQRTITAPLLIRQGASRESASCGCGSADPGCCSS